MKEEQTLRSAFEAMTERYGADRLQAKAQDMLSVIHATVKAFQAEGFPVTLEVRPEHDHCNVAFTDKTRLSAYFANGTISTGGAAIEFVLGRRPHEEEMKFLATWEGATVMRRNAIYDSAKKSWRDDPQSTYPYAGMDGPAVQGAASDDFGTALSTLFLHVLAKGELAARFNDDKNALDKPAPRLPSVKTISGP
jgi:hypothetical protein